MCFSEIGSRRFLICLRNALIRSAANAHRLVWLLAFVAAHCAAAPTIDPAVFGFKIPPGPVKPGEGQRLATLDEDNQKVVAKLHVSVGDQYIVMLPDGKLVGRSASEATATDQPFKAIEKNALAAKLATGKLSGFKTKTSRHFVFVYNTSEEFQIVTERVLATMVPGVMKYLETNNMKPRDPEVPMVVIMFKTVDEFQAYQRMPSGVVAYYTPTTNHVVLYEESRLGNIKPELAIQQSISTIAHEGAHQVLANLGIQQRLSVWPMWLSEGIAEYFAPTSTGKKLAWKGAGEVNDMRMFELEQYLKGRDSDPADGELITQTVLTARLTSTGYATAWSMTHFLAKQYRVEFHKMLAEVSKLGPLEGDLRVQPPGFILSNQKVFQQFFSASPAELEKKLVVHLKKLPYNDPFAEWPHFVALISSGTGKKTKRDANLFHSSSMAEKWRSESLEKIPSDLRSSAQSTIRMLPNRSAAEAVARQWLQGK